VTVRARVDAVKERVAIMTLHMNTILFSSAWSDSLKCHYCSVKKPSPGKLQRNPEAAGNGVSLDIFRETISKQ